MVSHFLGLQTLKTLKTAFPELRCYMVFSSRFGQCALKTEPEILEEFPKMVEDSPVLGLYLELKKKLQTGPPDGKLMKGLHEAALKVMDLEVRDDVFIELRFEQLNFELIGKLKTHPILQNQYNEEAARSIRIVIARINDNIAIEIK